MPCNKETKIYNCWKIHLNEKENGDGDKYSKYTSKENNAIRFENL